MHRTSSLFLSLALTACISNENLRNVGLENSEAPAESLPESPTSPDSPAWCTAQSDPGEAPREIAARQTVKIHIHTEDDGSVYVATQGTENQQIRYEAPPVPCSAFGIEGPAGSIRLAGDTQYSCTLGCSCAARGPVAGELTRLDRHHAIDLQWDARQLIQHRTYGLCPHAEDGCGENALDAFQPVAPGIYRVRIGLHDELPFECEDDGSGRAPCRASGANHRSLNGLAVCPAQRFVEVEFELPEHGATYVDVAVNTAAVPEGI